MLAKLRDYFKRQKQLCRELDRRMKSAQPFQDHTQLDKFLNR